MWSSKDTAFLVVLALGAVIAVVSIFWARHAMKKRRELMRSWAHDRGYAFDPDRDTSFYKRFKRFRPFSQGSGRTALHTATFEIDAFGRTLPVRLGDFTYVVSAGKSTQTHHLTYALATLPFAVPELRLRTESLTDRAAAALGFDDIDFEDAAFSQRFHVTAKNRRFAYDLFDPRMIELVNALPGKPAIETTGLHLLVTCHYPNLNSLNRRWSPEQCDEQVEFLRAFFERWPDHLLAQLESESSFRTGIKTESEP